MWPAESILIKINCWCYSTDMIADGCAYSGANFWPHNINAAAAPASHRRRSISYLKEVAFLSQLLNGVASVPQDALVAINVRDGRLDSSGIDVPAVNISITDTEVVASCVLGMTRLSRDQ